MNKEHFKLKNKMLIFFVVVENAFFDKKSQISGICENYYSIR